jgi:rhodanese-related sulfurtransferase
MNKEGYENIDQVIQRGTTGLSADKFEQIVNSSGALMLDTRPPQTFKNGFIPNSINIGINGNFAPWVGALIIDLKQPIVLITEDGVEEETITRLSRVGYDNTLGFLKGGIEAWRQAGKEIDTIESISANEFKSRLEKANIDILDVRKETEFLSEHIDYQNVENYPLDSINERYNELDKQKTYYIHCAGGYRSMITASILKARGFENIKDVSGGFKSIKESGVNVTAFVCPTTL